MHEIPTQPPVLVTDWSDFAAWACNAGYNEVDLNWRDSRCLALREEYLQEQADMAAAADDSTE